jgi:hypothetical protein
MNRDVAVQKNRRIIRLRNGRPKAYREPNASSDLIMAVARHTARLGAAENVRDCKREVSESVDGCAR